jgi:uncharacterized tellurite resistance protein B-like protein
VATEEQIDSATVADREAVASLINRSLDEDGRRRLIEMMWEVVYVDGRATEFEENVVWRAADPLGVPSHCDAAAHALEATSDGSSDPSR